jgi:cytochrome P450
MEELLNRFRSRYSEQLDELLPDCKEQEIDLYNFCKTTMFNSSCNAVFGRDFPCEAMSKDYARFEQSISYFIKGYPRLIDREGFQARENVYNYLKSYLADPAAVANASQLVISHMNSFEQKPEVNELDNKASYFMGILFASASNVVPAAFWIVAHTLATPGMIEKVRAIIAENYDAVSDTFNWEPLFANENLKSLISETLRLHSNITNARLVTEDTEMVIGPNKEKKVVKKGEVLLLVSDLVHWDPAVYPEPEKWIPERFLPENAGKLILAEKNWKAYVPWGGGLHMCSGRFFAMNEMVVQLTLMLWYFDITLHEEIPTAYIKERFGLGVAHPTKEMKASIVRREKSALRA